VQRFAVLSLSIVILQLTDPRLYAIDQKVIIRVFLGGHKGAQSIPWTSALQMLRLPENRFLVQEVTIKDVKDREFTPRGLVDWLLDSDIHIILSHLHQGSSGQNEQQLGWNMDELARQVSRLRDHVGFPTGHHLECPVFTQNKYEYLKAVPRYVNPSLRVQLSTDPHFQYDSPTLVR